MAKTIVAIFCDYDYAENAAYEIRENGLRTDNISIIVKNNKNNSYNNKRVKNNHNDMITEKDCSLRFTKAQRIADGIITGGIIGGVAGIIFGAASMFLKGLGLIAAAGPLTGLISGLVIGGIVGGLLDLGIPKEKSSEYQRLISDGNAFFSMRVDEERMDKIIDILKQNDAFLVEKY